MPIGTFIVLAHTGLIVQRGWLGSCGIALTYEWEEAGDHYQMRYCHLNKVLVDLGAVIQQGEIVAQSGNTGQSTGPHLHIHLERNGLRVRLEELLL